MVRYQMPRPEGRARKAGRRVASTLAAIALVGGIAVGFVPTRAVPLEYYVPPGVVEVNCGSLFSSTQWSLDEGCDREIMGRLMWMSLSLFVAVIVGLIALPLLILRYRIWLYGART